MEMPKNQSTKSINILKPSYFLGVFLFFCLSANVSIAQEAQLAYKGLSLELKFDESELAFNCDGLVALPAEDVSRKRGKACKFKVDFNRLGNMPIEIKADKTLVAKYLYKVVSLPEIDLVLDGHSGGKIDRDVFLALSQMQLIYNPAAIPYDVQIRSFKISHYRQKEKLFSSMCIKNKYNTQVQNLIQRVQDNDRVVIEDVEVQIGDFNSIEMGPLEFKIQK